MKLSLSQVRNYLNRLGISIIAGEPFDLGKIMPLNIARRYDAFRANIINDECIIMLPHNDDTSPDDIALHNTTLRNALLLRPIFAFPRLDREFASSLKSAKIAYIVPSRQVFIPPCVILESDRAYAEDEKPLGAHLTPWAQVVLLDCLLHERLPGYLIKYSSLAYVVTVIEMTGAAKIIATKYFAYFEAFAAVGIFYLILVSIATFALGKLEKKLAIPGVSGAKQE